MSHGRFLVSTVANGIEQRHLWEPEEPLRLSIRSRWYLRSHGAKMSLDELTGPYETSHVLHSIEIDENALAQDQVQIIELPSRLRVRIQQLPALPPAYITENVSPLRKGDQIQLLVFCGVGRAVMDSKSMFTAYVAYSRNKPVFTLQERNGKYTLRALLPGVRIKSKGMDPVDFSVGESSEVDLHELTQLSILRGSHWWRFNYVKSNEVLRDFAREIEKQLSEEEKNTFLKRWLLSLSIIFLLFSVGIWITPRKAVEIRPPVEKPIVKVVLPAPPPEAQRVAIPNQSTPQQLEPVVQEPKKNPTKASTKAAQKSRAPLKPQKPSEASSQRMVPAPQKFINKPASKPQQRESSKEIQSFRSSMSEILGMARNPAPHSVASSPSKDGLFARSKDSSQMGQSLAPTDIRINYRGSGKGIGRMGGGKGGGLDYSGSGTGMGQAPESTLVEIGGSSAPDVGLTKEEIGAVIHKHLAEIRQCHESAMLYTPSLAGKLQLQFTILPDGVVANVDVQSSTLTEQLLQNCVVKKLISWRFPKPRGGVRVVVAYPFLFKSLE